VRPYLIPKEERSLAEGAYNQTPAQLAAYYDYAQCINCLLCYAACPQYGLKPNFIGPAVLALLHRYDSDSRDQVAVARLVAARGDIRAGVSGRVSRDRGALSDACGAVAGNSMSVSDRSADAPA
jgi:succinate dehydrogenase/fumarate reductase-like Fe-S protein